MNNPFRYFNSSLEIARPAAPSADALKTLAEEAPPMRGGEYLDACRLTAHWASLAQAFEAERSGIGLTVGAFLAARDSRWRQVGRVRFNLAEKRKDAERPFAFLVTYASSLAAHGALRHAQRCFARTRWRGRKERTPEAPRTGEPGRARAALG
jgi:hypothetical protein